MPTRTRVVGSNFSRISWSGGPIAMLERVRDAGQAPLGGGGMGGGDGWEAIWELGEDHAVEVATTSVRNVGTLTLTIRELWDEPVWWQLHKSLFGTGTIVDVFNVLRSLNSDELSVDITVFKPVANSPNPVAVREISYAGISIVGVPDGEDITLGALTIARDITCVYRSKTMGPA